MCLCFRWVEFNKMHCNATYLFVDTFITKKIFAVEKGFICLTFKPVFLLKLVMSSPQKKKIPFTVSDELNSYFIETNRVCSIPIHYNDLLRFTSSVDLFDKYGDNTLWRNVIYPHNEMHELNKELTRIYAMLKTDGDTKVMEHLHVDKIDFCTFGNSKPFRIKIVNNYNDNYDYFYIKLPDASRLYGLEWEHILSPNRISYLISQHTLIEEHIVGIPGDQFIRNNLKDPHLNKTRLAKEFVKFNERCFIRLLGDMRSYNYVVDVTADFDDNQYRIRAIDFDQQSYEGKRTQYLPQYFKENNEIVSLCRSLLNTETVMQYQHEERSLIAKRLKSSKYRVNQLLTIMQKEPLSSEEKIKQLRQELYDHYEDQNYLYCETMGELMHQNLHRLANFN